MDNDAEAYGCLDAGSNLASCSTALSENSFGGGRYRINRWILNTILNEISVSFNNVWRVGSDEGHILSLTVDGRDLGQGESDGVYAIKWTNVTNLTLTDGQQVRLSLRLHIPPVSHRYGWCFNRSDMNASDCIGAIARWDQLSAQRNPITVSLDNDGRTEPRCPDTHRIRKATTSGIKCELTYSPVPAAGALAEAWGVTEIAPPSSLRDGWDGATRSCEPQSRGYVVLTTTRWHGLNQGCHAHSAIGGAHHEHSRQNH